ncbi:MAG: hypothetical protein F6K28_36580, partial [Microcoleus sp. SIO2G3]|nr:hypothetical protein [Microcoleus sp. SIO2G3]
VQSELRSIPAYIHPTEWQICHLVDNFQRSSNNANSALPFHQNPDPSDAALNAGRLSLVFDRNRCHRSTRSHAEAGRHFETEKSKCVPRHATTHRADTNLK